MTDSIDRNEVANITNPAIEDGTLLNLDDRCEMVDGHKRTLLPCEHEIHLDVPNPYPDVDFSDVMFVVATSYDRLKDSLPHFSHWLGGKSAKLVAVLTDTKLMDWAFSRITSQFASEKVQLIALRPYNKTIGVNAMHFTMIRDALRHAGPTIRWLAILDDDTFFPSLYPLRSVLDSHDASQPKYLGAMTESTNNLALNGKLAYGGAGVFLSRPLADKLEPQIEKCMELKGNQEGDALLSRCINNMTTTPLEIVNGLQQLDMHNDLSGFFESGRLPLTLHHWKSWFHAPIVEMAAVTKFCDSCFMQRWRIGPNAVFSNGYSLSVYPGGNQDVDLHKVESTWDESTADYVEALGEMRPKMDPAQKKNYILLDSERLGGSLRQIYVKRGDPDELVEMWWDFSKP